MEQKTGIWCLPNSLLFSKIPELQVSLPLYGGRDKEKGEGEENHQEKKAQEREREENGKRRREKGLEWGRS